MDDVLDEEMINLGELSSFKDYWAIFPCFKRMAADGFMFQARIVYEYDDLKKKIGGSSKVQISLGGYNEDGKVSIDESGPLVSEYFHLTFMPIFQTYKCDDEHNLVITGNSSKLGDYSVKIEVIKENC